MTTTIETSIEFARPAEDVFAVLADVRRLPEVSAMTVRVTEAPERLERVGQRFKQRVRLLGREFDSDWEVVAIEPPTLLRSRGTSQFGGRIELEERVADLGAGRSRLHYRFEYDLPLGFAGAVVARAVRGQAAKEAERVLHDLKAVVERF